MEQFFPKFVVSGREAHTTPTDIDRKVWILNFIRRYLQLILPLLSQGSYM